MREFSAGGVVLKNNEILLVQVKNLSGKIVWTFPKGHIEKGETAESAALREVEEETGYKCEIVEPLETTKYFFRRGKTTVYKEVVWFLMRPVEKTGTHDDEILTTQWMNIKATKEYLKYKTDLAILEKIL